jgi:hypothetical protein
MGFFDEMVKHYRDFKRGHGGSFNEWRKLWEKQSDVFRGFWKNKMMNHGYKLSEDADLDPIIQILDVKGKRTEGRIYEGACNPLRHSECLALAVLRPQAKQGCARPDEPPT